MPTLAFLRPKTRIKIQLARVKKTVTPQIVVARASTGETSSFGIRTTLITTSASIRLIRTYQSTNLWQESKHLCFQQVRLDWPIRVVGSQGWQHRGTQRRQERTATSRRRRRMRNSNNRPPTSVIKRRPNSSTTALIPWSNKMPLKGTWAACSSLRNLLTSTCLELKMERTCSMRVQWHPQTSKTKSRPCTKRIKKWTSKMLPINIPLISSRSRSKTRMA